MKENGKGSQGKKRESWRGREGRRQKGEGARIGNGLEASVGV